MKIFHFISVVSYYFVNVLCYLVHVHHSLDSIDLSLGLNGLSLPSDSGQGDIGGEEEEQTEESQQRDDDGGQVQSSLGSIRWSSIITLHRSSISLGWSTISVWFRSTVSIISPDSGPANSRGK